MLEFIGCGSAFHTELGNNSAFYIKGQTLFLIDCGSSTFARLRESGILQKADRIHVVLTHTHADHVGSLGDLVLYGYWIIGKMAEPAVTVYAPKDLNIRMLLDMMGAEEKTYILKEFTPGEEIEIPELSIRFEAVPVRHVPELHCFGYVLRIQNELIYYSGDCCEIPASILEKLTGGVFGAFYQDTCKADYEDNVHLSLRKLAEIIGPAFRDKVYCMHQDEGFDRDEAEKLGFQVVKPYGEK
ncbi:hypothetical protein BpJC4_12140 [Weizmannia acidilactici]|uniref:MBL fold metallo-hydrolase n=1 Tax=Weizmannia acidilactici TaxID=2607726 RepID=UPI00124D3A20|nr:MBL fold metallo-hydrolase [Weizmannia acidilactici]GER66743.1 hypothetical protein BpJC4_12140 [Weizmannia acidilactici]